MDAVISGQAGVAVLLDGPKLASIHSGSGGSVVARGPGEVRLLLGDARDLDFVEDVEPQEVTRRLELATSKYDALHLALILLDETLSAETRRCAAEELEELLEVAEVGSFPERVLCARPFPRGADPVGADASCTGRTPRTRSLLRRIVSLQDVIARVHWAWESIAVPVFGSEDGRAHALAVAVREGLFRDLVQHRAAGHPSSSFRPARTSSDWEKVERHDSILKAWLAALQEIEDSALYPERAVEPSAVAEDRGQEYSVEPSGDDE